MKAFSEMRVKPRAGENVGSFLSAMVELARTYECRVIGTFNDKTITCESSWEEHLARQYYATGEEEVKAR